MMHGQANVRYEIYLLIKYIKSVLWRAAKRLSYIEDARCLKVNLTNFILVLMQYLIENSVFVLLRSVRI